LTQALQKGAAFLKLGRCRVLSRDDRWQNIMTGMEIISHTEDGGEE